MSDFSLRRFTCMVAELGFLCLIQTLPNFLKGTSDQDILAVPGLYTAPLLVYLLVNYHWLRQVHGLVWALSAVHFLGAAGVLTSLAAPDFFTPLHNGVHCLCVMGVFAHKYYRLGDVRRLAVCAYVLIPLAMWFCTARNNIDLFGQSSNRFGTNLIGWFAAVQCAFVFALPGPCRFLALLPLGIIIRSGSRSALGAVIIHFAVVHLLSRDRTLRWDRLAMVLVAIIVLAVAAMASDDLMTMLPNSLSPMGGWERLTNPEQASSVRAVPLTAWWLFLCENPTLTGHGITTYGTRYVLEDLPHNGILHLFNGYGVIAGLLYLWSCLACLITFWRTRAPLPEQVVWAIGFTSAILFRGMVECTTVGESLHTVGVFTAYGVGAGLYAAMKTKTGGMKFACDAPQQVNS